MINRRYPGARPFTKEQQAIFYGREEDVQRLQRMLSLETLSVLYGKSGYGKSSLINAGLLPKIEQNKHEQAVLIRFQAWTEDSTVSPLERIRHSLRELPYQTKELDKLSPQEDSLWYWAKAYQYSHPENRLILLFDQFEELFSYPEADIRAFKQQLAELVRGQLPTRFDEILDIAADRDEAPLTPAEEEQLYQPLNVRINFSIRSDRMHLLDQLSDYLPNVLRNNMELKALKEEDAEKALVFPAQMQGAFTAAPFSYSAAAKDKIINFLKNKEDGLVEAIQLQILCTSFEDKAIRDKVTHFDEMSKEELDAIIKNFYHDQLAKIPHAHDRELAAILLEDGLVDKERKERLTLHETQIERLFHVPSSLLGDLVGFSLLRREPDRRSGYTYELSHDTFIKPALAAREKREIAKAEQKRQQQAEELKAEKRKRRNSYLFAAFAGLLALVAIVASIIASQQQAKAEQALTQAQAEKARADSLKDEATTQLALTQIARDSAQTAKLRADSLLQVAISQEALAKAEAAKGNRLETTLAGSDDDIYDYLLAEGTNSFNKGQYQNALTYWANAAFFGENRAGKKQLQERIGLAKAATLVENDFQNGRLEKARTGFQQLLAQKTDLEMLQAQKRITQINQSQQIWASATEGKLLDTIQSLTLRGNVSSIPEEAQQMSRLSELIIQYNQEDAIFLNTFPPTIDSIRFNKVNFAELPSLNNFAGLKLVEIRDANRIGGISKEWINPLQNLKELTISNNDNLNQIPPLNQLLNLKKLTISNNTNLNQIPPLNQLPNLKSLDIAYNDKTTQIPPLNQLLNLNYLTISGNDNLNQIPPLNQLLNLKALTIFNNQNLNQIPPLNQLLNLKKLTISNNTNLNQIPPLNQLLNLKKLTISSTDNLNQIPPLNQLLNLKKLTISNNTNLNQIPPLNQLLNLKELTISNNTNLNQIPPLNQLPNLEKFYISDNNNLNQIPPLNQLPNLEKLHISDNNLNQIPPLNQLLNLKDLYISDNDNLNQIPPLNQLLNLKALTISDNDNLNQIPPLNQLLNLKALTISRNENLTQIPILPTQMDSLKTLSIEGTYLFNKFIYSMPIQSLPAVIGEYSALVELNLAALEITDLPPSFEKLKDTLKKLNLRYNPMTKETVEKWRKLLPNTEVIFEPRPENK